MFGNDVVFLQRILKSAGLYVLKIDGDYGPGTQRACEAFEEAYDKIGDIHGWFDRFSEKNIATLLPKAQELARKHLDAILKSGQSARIICGTRTYQEQNNLYASGRTKPGKIITKARGGYSWHNFGLAWDIGLFKDTDYLDDEAPYKAVGPISVSLGIEWGGAWRSFCDLPHYQLKLKKTIDEVRVLFESGKL